VSTAARARSPRPVTATRDGCWSRPRGTTAKRYRPSRELVRLQDSQPPAVRARAELGNRRPHQRWNRLDARANRPTISAVAVARELAGWGKDRGRPHKPPAGRLDVRRQREE
jgi:hypothetical protein